jgi:hypothetical protein
MAKSIAAGILTDSAPSVKVSRVSNLLEACAQPATPAQGQAQSQPPQPQQTPHEPNLEAPAPPQAAAQAERLQSAQERRLSSLAPKGSCALRGLQVLACASCALLACASCALPHILCSASLSPPASPCTTASSPLLIILRVCVSPTVVHLQTPLLATEVERSETLVRVGLLRAQHLLSYGSTRRACCRTALRLCFSRRGLRVSGRTKSWTREPRGRRRAGNRKREGRCIAGLSCLSPMSHTYLLSRMSHTCRVPTGLLPVSSVACLSRNTLLHCPKLNRILQFSPPVGTLSRIARTREWIHVG